MDFDEKLVKEFVDFNKQTVAKKELEDLVKARQQMIYWMNSEVKGVEATYGILIDSLSKKIDDLNKKIYKYEKKEVSID